MFGKKEMSSTEISNKSLKYNYKMKKEYRTDRLVVGNLQSVTPTTEVFLETSDLKYIFEEIEVNGRFMYQEVFTGFIADTNKSREHFNLYIVDLKPLNEVLDNLVEVVPKFSLLTALNDVNAKEKVSVSSR